MTTRSASPRDIPSILIVDDTLANLEVLSGMLKDRGYEPRPVPSGKLALLAARSQPPDVILLDIRMPEMDGFEVCARLKADDALKEIPVIFISALDETADKVKAFSLGAVDYVTKPFQAEEVEARVRTHLRIRALQDQLRLHNEELEQVVAQRTRDLAQAIQRLRELGQLKDDVLRMISHELRTPANGVLGMAQLIIDLCPPSADCAKYRGHFDRSRVRLLNLIDDTTMIANLEQHAPESRGAISLGRLFAKVTEAFPHVRIQPAWPTAAATVPLKGDPELLKRAVETIVLLAITFSTDKHCIAPAGVVEAQIFRMTFALDAVPLPEEAAAGFFNLESLARPGSSAEALGLAPVVAQKILSAFGGGLRLVKTGERAGYLEVTFLKDPEGLRPA